MITLAPSGFIIYFAKWERGLGWWVNERLAALTGVEGGFPMTGIL